MRIFGADVDVALGRADGDAGNGHAFDQDERIAFHDHAIGERAAVAFVGIADDVFPVGLGVGDRLPLDAGRESGAAAAAQAGLGDLFDDAARIGQRFGETFVAVVRFVVVERARIDDAAAGEGEAGLLLEERMLLRHADAQFVIAAAGDHRVENAVHVVEFDRTVGNAALLGRDLEQRLEPVHAARAVAHDLDRDIALRGSCSDRGRNLVGAASDRGGVAGNVDAKRAHRSTSAMRPSSFLASSRATTLPSIMADGDTEQSPRQ